MTLLNLSLTTLNADGSTTIFGAAGNAIENLVSGHTTTVFATPTSPATAFVPIWYAPAPTDEYFQNILNNPQLFQTIGDIKVFKMYLALNWPDTTLKAFFAYCSANNVQLGVEAPALVANAGQPGAGIEGFASTGAMLAAMTRIKHLGGSLSYVSWDEPLYYGSTVTGLYSMAEVASQVAAASGAVRALFPNVQIGDIEPVDPAMDSPTTLQAWFAAYAKAYGTQFTSFQADVNTESLNWQSNLASTIAVADEDHIPVGEIITGNDGAATTNDAWAAMAVANAMEMLSDPALRPDYLDVQSWQIYPSETSDPKVPGTFASVAADIAAGESAALAVPAIATYAAAGILQSVRWSSGCTAIQNGTSLIFTMPTGTIASQIAWSDVQVFAFNPNTGAVSLTAGNTTQVVNAASGNFVFTPVNSVSGESSDALTLTLTLAVTMGFAGSGGTDQVTPTFVGEAAPNSTIQVQVDGQSAGTVVASAAGAWTFTVAAPLTAGAHLIEATSKATSGVASQNCLYVVSVDPIASSATVSAAKQTSSSTLTTGKNTIVAASDAPSGGDSSGTAVVGNKITGISDVRLAKKSTFAADGSANLLISASAGGAHRITLGAASQNVTSGGVKEISVGGLTGDTVILDAPTKPTFSPVQFIHAAGSSGTGTIIDGAASQMLTGGSGIGIKFQATAAGLYRETIRNFRSMGQTDITNLSSDGAMLTATPNKANMAATVTSGATNVRFLMSGSFTQSGFTLTGDGASGTIVTHT